MFVFAATPRTHQNAGASRVATTVATTTTSSGAIRLQRANDGDGDDGDSSRSNFAPAWKVRFDKEQQQQASRAVETRPDNVVFTRLFRPTQNDRKGARAAGIRTRSGSAPERRATTVRATVDPVSTIVASEYLEKVSRRRSPSRSPHCGHAPGGVAPSPLKNENAGECDDDLISKYLQSSGTFDRPDGGEETAASSSEQRRIRTVYPQTPDLPSDLRIALRSMGYSVRGEQLSNGAFSRVFCVQSTTGMWAAAKAFSATIGARSHYVRERSFLCEVAIAASASSNRPPLISMLDGSNVDEDRDGDDGRTDDRPSTSGILLLELACGGDAFDYVAEHGPLPTRAVRELARRIFSGLEYMHRIGWVHGDVKLENVLLMVPEDLSSAKLSDFGCARRVGRDDEHRSPASPRDPEYQRCKWLSRFDGTMNYAAPEVLPATDGGIGRGGGGGGLATAMFANRPVKATDVWCAGIACYVALAKRLPFCVLDADGNCVGKCADDPTPTTPLETMICSVRALREAHVTKTDAMLRYLAESVMPKPEAHVVELVSATLSLSPSKRPTANECLESRWLRNARDEQHIEPVVPPDH